jgi:hypothetical protein
MNFKTILINVYFNNLTMKPNILVPLTIHSQWEQKQQYNILFIEMLKTSKN